MSSKELPPKAPKGKLKAVVEKVVNGKRLQRVGGGWVPVKDKKDGEGGVSSSSREGTPSRTKRGTRSLPGTPPSKKEATGAGSKATGGKPASR